MRIAGAIAAALLLLEVHPAVSSDQTARSAVPLEPVSAVIDAFQTHPVVALPGKPVTREITKLILSIITDARFPKIANDIVVEFGNARYQDLIDRYTRGDAIPDADLRKVWQDTTEATGTFDGPLTEEVFRAVRDVNSRLPPAQRLRILAGDPPIDWDNVKERGDHRKWVVRRDSHAADVVRSEVLARGRKALLLYGHLHYPRKEIMANYDMADWQAQTLTSLIEKNGGARVFVIWTEGLGLHSGKIQAGTETWPTYAIAHIRGTVLGAADFTAFNESRARYAIRGPEDFVEIPKDQWKSVKMEDQADAVMKLPATQTNALPLPGLCSQPGYAVMRIARSSIAGLAGEAERIRRTCGVPKLTFFGVQ